LVIALKNAVITHISLGATTDGTIIENITFNYNAVSITYRPQLDQNTLGGAVSFEYTKSTSK
jgi:type VI protein secretion system component Hcp